MFCPLHVVLPWLVGGLDRFCQSVCGAFFLDTRRVLFSMAWLAQALSCSLLEFPFWPCWLVHAPLS